MNNISNNFDCGSSNNILNDNLNSYYFNQYSSSINILPPSLPYKSTDSNDGINNISDFSSNKANMSTFSSLPYDQQQPLKVDINDYAQFVNMDFYPHPEMAKTISASDNSEPSPNSNSFNSPIFQNEINNGNSLLNNYNANIKLELKEQFNDSSLQFDNSTKGNSEYYSQGQFTTMPSLKTMNNSSNGAINNFSLLNNASTPTLTNNIPSSMDLLNNYPLNNNPLFHPRLNYPSSAYPNGYYNSNMLQTWQEMLTKGYGSHSSMFGLNNSNRKTYSFVTMNATKTRKRHRRKHEEIERLYKCTHGNCDKSYGTLNNLNAHITMQKHGNKKSAFEFKAILRKAKSKVLN